MNPRADVNKSSVVALALDQLAYEADKRPERLASAIVDRRLGIKPLAAD